MYSTENIGGRSLKEYGNPKTYHIFSFLPFFLPYAVRENPQISAFLPLMDFFLLSGLKLPEGGDCVCYLFLSLVHISSGCLLPKGRKRGFGGGKEGAKEGGRKLEGKETRKEGRKEGRMSVLDLCRTYCFKIKRIT